VRHGISSEDEGRAPRIRRGIYLLPNLFTTAGLLAGFYATVATLDRRFVHAVGGVIFAVVMDGLDGRVARLTGTATPFGREYDSLSDMVAFGIAPALLAYRWTATSLPAASRIASRALWLGAFFYAVAAALRLARFNTHQAHDRRYFQGLPSPSAALLVVSAVWLETEERVAPLSGLRLAVLALALVAAALMVSRFAYPSFKELPWQSRVRYSATVLVPIVLIIVLLAPAPTLLAFSLLYALAGPAGSVWSRWRRRGRREAV
jgi:CDP-diacylglycerol--serine O-phosphatidyltransferase